MSSNTRAGCRWGRSAALVALEHSGVSFPRFEDLPVDRPPTYALRFIVAAKQVEDAGFILPADVLKLMEAAVFSDIAS